MNIQKLTSTANSVKNNLLSKAKTLKNTQKTYVSYKELGNSDKLEKIESIFTKNGNFIQETKSTIDFNKEPLVSKILIAGNMVVEDIAVKIVDFLDKFKK